MYVHLTNYSLNKKNNNFDGDKHKLKLSDYLPTNSPNNMFTTTTPEKGTYSKKSNDIWIEIEDIVIKTIITVQP